jgi:hypothetical protein
MDMVSCTCSTATWVLSHIASAASLRSGRSTPASCETSTQQMESLEVDLLGPLDVNLVPLIFLLQKNLECLTVLSQVGSVRSTDQPMGLADANSTSLR